MPYPFQAIQIFRYTSKDNQILALSTIFFSEGLQAWQANIDIQPVFNHCKAVTYMCAYFSKAEDETSEAMKQAKKEALNVSKTELETMKAIAKTKRESSV